MEKGTRGPQSCSGFKKICWLKKSKGNQYCSTCDKEYMLDTLDILKKQKSPLTQDKYPLIRKAIQYDPKQFDTFVSSLLSKKTNDMRNIFYYFYWGQSRHILQQRFKTHVGGDACKIFKWVLRDRNAFAYVDEWYPESCLRCQGNLYVWTNLSREKCRQSFVDTVPDRFVHNARKYANLQPDDYVNMMNSLVYKIIDYSYSMYLVLKPRIGDTELCKKFEYHPHVITTLVLHNNFENVKPFLREWIELYKEELIAKTWHPNRFMEWCLDEEEKRDFQLDL